MVTTTVIGRKLNWVSVVSLARLVKPSMVMLAVLAAGCVSSGQVVPPDRPTGATPYVAVQKQLPQDENRIYLLAALPGHIVIAENCVLFKRLDGEIVLPVFEHGVVAGRDRHGAWIYDPFLEQYFRHSTKVIAGGGGSGETIAQMERRRVLPKAVPGRCRSAVTQDTALFLNPGLKAVDFDE